MYKEYCVWYVCCFCTGNVQFVASSGWREKFIRRHPEVRTKVTEVGTYLCQDICSVTRVVVVGLTLKLLFIF